MSSTITVRELMSELKNIEAETKRKSLELKAANMRKKELKEKIYGYLEDKDLPGLKYQDITVMRTETNTRARKKKADKDQSAIKILEEAGVDEPEKVYASMVESQKGEKITKTQLKVQNNLPEIE